MDLNWIHQLDERQIQSGSFYIILKESALKYINLGEWTPQFQTPYSLDIIFHMVFIKTCGPDLGGRVSAVFLPAEAWLTLRKVSRDPFSMNSVMIITGLPTEAHNKAVVNGAELRGSRTPTIKSLGQRSSGVHSCDQPSSLSLSRDNMACRHQSHWQLLIRPLHKRQEIIRMDQSTRICVCVGECVCV